MLASAPVASSSQAAVKRWPHSHRLAAGTASQLRPRQLKTRERTRLDSNSPQQQPARELWGDPSSNVRPIELDSFRLMHRGSFSHRNLRTYMIVVYVPGSTRCADIEDQVERLATGLGHEPRVVVAKLNALGSNDAFLFCTSVLEVKQYPTIFLYPEGTPGCMRFTGTQITPEALLAAINGCFRKVFPNRQPLQLSAEPAVRTTSSSALEQRQVLVGTPAPIIQSLSSVSHGYWGPGKLAFWGFIALFSVGAFCWDRWGEAWWIQRGLAQRQQQRKEGVDFDEDTNVEDLLNLSLLTDRPLTKEQAIREVEVDNDDLPTSRPVDASQHDSKLPFSNVMKPSTSTPARPE